MHRADCWLRLAPGRLFLMAVQFLGILSSFLGILSSFLSCRKQGEL